MSPGYWDSFVADKLPIITDNWQAMLEGTWTTVWLVACALLIGLLIAIPCGAILATAKSRWLRWPVAAYSYCFRGTPLLVQAYIFYYGIGVQIGEIPGIEDSFWWPVLQEAWCWALLTLTLNTGAYTCEIVRGAIETTPHGEIEAAKAMGMSRFLMLRRIVLPSAFRRALSMYSNEIIFLLQGSAIISAITVLDITGVARNLYAHYYEPYIPFMMAGAIYLLIVCCVVLATRRVEKRWLRHLKIKPM